MDRFKKQIAINMQRMSLIPMLLVTLMFTSTASSTSIQPMVANPNALTDLKATALNGDLKAQSALGSMYFDGNVVEQDYAESLKWYQLAAKQGDEFSQLAVGDIFSNGLGTPIDYELAFAWYNEAAKRENALAQYRLGLAYENGHGVIQDFEVAFYWHRLAAIQGVKDAKMRVANMYAEGRGAPRDKEKAYLWCYMTSGIVLINQQDQCASFREVLNPMDTWKIRMDARDCTANNYQDC